MSNYPNGQPYHAPYAQGSQYSASSQVQSGLQRTSSFNAGDDARFFDQTQAHGQGQEQEQAQAQAQNNRGASSGYAPFGGSPAPVHQPFGSPTAHQSSIPYRPAAQQPNLGGYQHQQQYYPHQYQAPVPGNIAYNPAQYQSPVQYSPQSWGTTTTPYQPSAYQPYIPAAYQDTSNMRQPSIPSGQYYNSQNLYSHATALPSRPPESTHQPQGNVYGAYQHEAHSAHAVPYTPSLASTGAFSPTSPPGPPPPLHQTNLPSSLPYPLSDAAPPYDLPYNQTLHANTSPPPRLSPDIQRNYSSASRVSQVSAQSATVSTSSPSLPTPPSRDLSQREPSSRGNTLERHPTGRQLPGVPSESESDNDYFISHRAQSRSPAGYEDLLTTLDAAIDSTTRASDQTYGSLFEPDERPTHLNGVVSAGDNNINYGAFANDSDAEAAAGLAAMQAADEQEAAEEERRRSSQQQYQYGRDPGHISTMDRSDDSDYAGYDLSSAGGGYAAGPMSYGSDNVPSYSAVAAPGHADDYSTLNPRMSSIRSEGVSSDGRASANSGFEWIPPVDAMHPFPPLRTDVARVDTGGTGGLTQPSSAHPRRRSYEDGDENDLLSSSQSPSRESIPDLFFHPGMSPQRPLPPPPPPSDPGNRVPYIISAGTSPHQTRFQQYDSTPPAYPSTPDYYQNRSETPSSAVPRSTSLVSTRSIAKPEQPIRSKTDADRAARAKQAGRQFSEYETSTPQSAGAPLDLPTIPRRKFNPAKISSEQFRKCSEPWALSSVLAWIRDLAEEETDLKESALAEGITALFTHKVPTMNTTEAESLGDKFVKQMLDSGALLKDEEWVKFGAGEMTGVMYQLTGTGCYSARLHLQPQKGRCYSHHCMRTLKKVDLSIPQEKKMQDWVTYYNIAKEDLDRYDKKEVQRQNILHEVVSGEQKFISDLDLLRVMYRDQLQNMAPPILPEKKRTSFLREVFGDVDKIKKVNEDYLLAQLKYRQNEQGPFITGFSDIFREWIRRARNIYVDYATNYPRADFLVRREAERNYHFRNFLDQCRADPRSDRLGWDTYLKNPITRIQRYSLLLESVLKNQTKDSDEKRNLISALDEVRSATHECNQKLGEAERKIKLLELQNKIKLRSQLEVVELNLDHLGRRIIYEGDLQRSSGRGFQLVDTHAILFDHYLVLAKILKQYDSAGNRKAEQYDVSKAPIPMDLISLESTNDAPVVKSSMKGIAAVTTTMTPRGQPVVDPRLARTTSTTSGGSLQQVPTGLSTGSGSTGQSLVATTVLDAGKDDKIMYPFRVKHLGRAEVYILFAATADVRDQWCQAIISAKQDHAEALYAQNAEPFKLRVLADTAFGGETYSVPQKGISIVGTPLHRAVQDAEARYVGSSRPAPICRASVNCATVFQQPFGRFMCAIGTDYGVYVSEYGNPRGWTRAIQMQRVTQISVLEEFNLFLLISDKVLIAYHLDVVCPVGGPVASQNDASMRKAPQKLSGAKDVGFFQTGRMKDRALVFYKKRDGNSSVFKVLEPVLQKSATSRSRFLPTSSRRGQTDFFRDYDEFYIPTETYSINLFHSSLAVSTAKGVEVLTLDKKQPWTVPNLRSDQPEAQVHLSSIAARIKDLKPLGMFRLSQSEFLLIFEECAIYVNQFGDISRGVVMEFVGKAKSACLFEQYLILCDEDFAEIRDAQNGRLKQVIAAKEMRMLDDGGNLMPGTQTNNVSQVGSGANGLDASSEAPRTVKLSMQHPDYEKSYVIVELFLSSNDKT